MDNNVRDHLAQAGRACCCAQIIMQTRPDGAMHMHIYRHTQISTGPRYMYSGIRILLTLTLALGGLWAFQAHALEPGIATGEELARQSKCLACHQVDTRRVGPPFQAISRRFHGQENAELYLARVIRQGSRGQWGAIPMPAQPGVSETEARLLALWILSLSGPESSADNGD